MPWSSCEQEMLFCIITSLQRVELTGGQWQSGGRNVTKAAVVITPNSPHPLLLHPLHLLPPPSLSPSLGPPNPPPSLPLSGLLELGTNTWPSYKFKVSTHLNTAFHCREKWKNGSCWIHRFGLLDICVIGCLTS